LLYCPLRLLACPQDASMYISMKTVESSHSSIQFVLKNGLLMKDFFCLHIITGLLFSSPLFITSAWAQSPIPPHLKSHIEQLHQGNPLQRQQAVESLAKAGKPAVPALITALQHHKPEVRVHAAKALSQIGINAAPALNALSQAMQDKDNNVRVEATQAFTIIGRQAIVPRLVANLRSENPSTRYNAAHALTRLGKYAQSAVPTLIQTLEDKETWVRLTAATALGNIGLNALPSLPALQATLDDEDISVRHNVAYALGAIGVSVQEQASQVSTSDLDKMIAHLEKADKVVANPNLKFRQQAIASIQTPLEALKKEKLQRTRSSQVNLYTLPLSLRNWLLQRQSPSGKSFDIG
jgi:HEAT repeat protein